MNSRNIYRSIPTIKYLKKYEQIFQATILTSVIFIASCGKDAGIDYKNEQGEPVASAKALLLGEQTASEPTTYQARANSEVTLTGKDSDSDYAPILQFDWEQVDSSGYDVELIERNDSTSVFNAPNVNTPTQLQFKLSITDANGKSDEDLVSINIIPADDVDHFISHPTNSYNKFYIKAVLNDADSTDATTDSFSFDVVTIAHWIRRDGSNDQLEINRQTINSEFPANFAPTTGYNGINDPRNPVMFIPIPRIDADDINKHFETVERERRVERYLIDDIILETKIELTNNGGKTFEFFALDTIDPTIDLTPHIIDLTNLVFEGPITATEILDSSEASVSLSVTKLLSAMNLESYITASNYYDLIDPAKEFEKLEDWFIYAGFKDINGNWIATDAARALYVNNYDLGFGRDMYSRKDADGNVFSFVVNYQSIEAGINKLGEFALVAMEYTANPDTTPGADEKIVKFYAYIYDEREGGFVRSKSLNFDGRGEKYIPGACTGCHQGISGGKDFLDITQADLGATFLPWDVSAFLFADAEEQKYIESTLNLESFSAAQISQYSREAQEEQIRQLNLHALATYVDNPSEHSTSIELVHGWYGDETNRLPVDELPESTFNEDFTPSGWAAEPELYHDVFAGHCRMCHTQLNSATKNFDNYNEFITNTKLINYVYKRGLMPLARLSMDRFWASIYNSTSAADILRAHLESLGSTVPAFPGAPVPSMSVSPAGIGIATVNDVITVNASGSLFSSSFVWSLTPPFGSSTILGSTSGPITSFQADTPGGDYDLQLTVYNDNGDSETLTTTISIIDRTPTAECLTANSSAMTAAGALDNIPVVSQLSVSLGDGGVYISDVIDGTYGTASIDADTQTINYQLNNPFSRGSDTIYYQVMDADGSPSNTNALCGNGGHSGYAAITIDSTPTGNLNPGSLSATRDSVKNTYEIDLSWAAPTGITAESYKVYKVGNATPIATVTAPTTSYSHTGLTPNTTYDYEVTAVVASSESSPSSSASATTLALLPTTLAAPTATTSQIGLTWSAPTGSVSNYKVYLEGNGTAIATVTAPTTAYTHTGLTSGQTYKYQVSGVDALPQESSKTASVTKTVIPAAPTGLVLSAGADPTSEIQLNWTTPSGVRDHYCIYRDGSAAGTTTSNSYLDTGSGGLASYHLYSYYVTAVSASTTNCIGVESSQSNTQTLRTAAAGGATTEPVLDSATVDVVNDASEIDLAWTPATAITATGYKVYRGGSLIATLGDVTSYSNTGLTYNTSYSYKVTALYDPGDGSTAETAFSNTITTSTDSLIPSGVGGSATSTTAITVTWAAPAANVDASGYTIYRDGVSRGTSSAATFNDTGLTEGTVYAYTITAKQGSQTSSASAAGNVATMPTAPSAPTFGTQTTSSLVVNWTAPDADSGYTYDVQFSTDNSTWSSLVTGVSTLTSTHTGRTAGTLYYYRVRAIKNSVNSAWGSSASKSTLPNAPTGVTAADATATTTIGISWTAPASGNVSTYNVYRGATLICSGSATTSCSDTGRTPGTSFSYTVKSVANSELSAASSADNGYTAPNNVTIGTATATSKSAITLTWTNATGASSYNIYNDSTGLVVLNDAGTPASITGLSSYTAYTFKIKAVSADGFESLSFSGNASATTYVSYSTNIGNGLIGTGGSCTGCHGAALHQGTSGADVSAYFPTCVTNNSGDCSAYITTGCVSGTMCWTPTHPYRDLIRSWVSEGSNRSN